MSSCPYLSGGRRKSRRNRQSRKPRRKTKLSRPRNRRSFRRRRTRRHRGGSGRRTWKQKGGKAWKSGGGNPAIGFAWSGEPSTWPGVTGGHNGATVSNHYPKARCGGIDIPVATRSQGGGGRCGRIHRRGRGQRGGWGVSSFFPQPMVNAWRDATGKLWNVGYGYAGMNTPSSNNPDPTHQPIDKNYEYIGGTPPDVAAINQYAGDAVAQLGTN